MTNLDIFRGTFRRHIWGPERRIEKVFRRNQFLGSCYKSQKARDFSTVGSLRFQHFMGTKDGLFRMSQESFFS